MHSRILAIYDLLQLYTVNSILFRKKKKKKQKQKRKKEKTKTKKKNIKNEKISKQIKK